MIGLITPPYGLLLFVVANITRTPLTALIRDIWPFILALIVALMVIAYVPEVVLWLPRLYGYRG
jgi:C4-dicarboxylate transporter DctM subunit